MKNIREIREKEVRSFLKTWFENTNDDIVIYDAKQQPIKVPNIQLTHLYSDILNAFDANKNHKIVGCDRMQKFQICLSNKEDLLKTAQELWDNPNTFYTEENNKDYDQYSDFLKYLWIESHDFPEETRLTDIIKTIEL